MWFPWMDVNFLGWTIGAMNHYTIDRHKYLYVLMRKGDRCIVEQGIAESHKQVEEIFSELAYKAVRL